jgi:SAM-dependent methyltransferase
MAMLHRARDVQRLPGAWSWGGRRSWRLFVMDRSISQHHSIGRSYDAVAEEYAAGFGDELAGKPLDRALLACLAEQAEGGARIADLGCGPGHVAAWLAGHGVTAVGIDLSPGMIAVGRREYPAVEFREGDLLELPAADGEFAAAVAFYSIIHLEPGELRRACDEIHRVLRPGALFLVAFQSRVVSCPACMCGHRCWDRSMPGLARRRSRPRGILATWWTTSRGNRPSSRCGCSGTPDRRTQG